MKRNKYLTFLIRLLKKLSSVLWPWWLIVISFLFFYATQLEKFLMVSFLIY